MRLGFVTLFPDVIRAHMESSILGRAASRGLLSWECANPRDFAYDAHRKTDDAPYGGEAGMLLKPEPVRLALSNLVRRPVTGRADLPPRTAVVVTEPGGAPFDQIMANRWAALDRVLFVCGHYEGIDHRLEERFATDVVSIGDYVLTGGELPALVMADAVARRVAGVLGSADSLVSDSFSEGRGISAPNYTRPPVWLGGSVPPVLASGDHSRVAAWRDAESARRTAARPKVSRVHLLDLWAYDGWANRLLLPLADATGGRAAAAAAHIRWAREVWEERIGTGWETALRTRPLDERIPPSDRLLADVAVHLANHGTFHRGQIRGYLDEGGIDFPNTDWIYWRDAGSPQDAGSLGVP